MRTRDEIVTEMNRLRERALAQVVPGDEQSNELHAWIALAWVLGADVQQEELRALIDRVREVEPTATILA